MIEVVVCIVVHEKKVLLVHRASDSEKLTWVFPGGTVEEGETVLDTAIRELKEETNVDSKVISIIGERIHPFTKKHMAYVALSPTSFDLALGDEDLDDVRWIDISEIKNYFSSPLFESVDRYLLELC